MHFSLSAKNHSKPCHAANTETSKVAPLLISSSVPRLRVTQTLRLMKYIIISDDGEG